MSLFAITPTSLAGVLTAIIGGQRAPEPVKTPNSTLVASLSSDVGGTMTMVHGGGWTGPGPPGTRDPDNPRRIVVAGG